MKSSCSNFLNKYTTLITNGYTAFSVYCLWMLFIAVSILGIFRINIDFSLIKLFRMDSPLIQAESLRVEYRIPQNTVGEFFINNPGDLSDPGRFNRLNQMIYELEHMEMSWGPESSRYFIRDFIAYENASEHIGEDESSKMRRLRGEMTLFNEKDLKEFLGWPEYEIWKGFVQLDSTGSKLKGFLFTTSYHGDELKFWPARVKILNKWRTIVDKYSADFNVTVVHDDGGVLDWIANMPTDAWQSAVGTLICMAFIFFIFLYDICTVIAVSLSVIAIMTEVIGTASWLGIDLEPLMLATIVISLGCSIDIPAHVTYHYKNADLNAKVPMTVKEKTSVTLAAVGLPALQTSLSTNLCVLSLIFAPVYVGQVLFRMMVLCITLCVIHGLIIIPALFTLMELSVTQYKRFRKKFLLEYFDRTL